MKLTAATAKRLRRLVEDVIALDADESPLAHEAKQLLPVFSSARARGQRARDRGPRVNGATREDRREAHAASTTDLRVTVWIRSGGSVRWEGEVPHFEGEGHCEACGVELGKAWELHHVEGGGDRRPKQRLGNILALCWECHRRAHRGDLGTLAQIAQAPTLDAEAERAALRRIAKIEEARRAARKETR